MLNIQETAHKLSKLSERDLMLVNTMIETLLDPEWINESEGDKQAYLEAKEDYEKGVYYTHNEVWE